MTDLHQTSPDRRFPSVRGRAGPGRERDAMKSSAASDGGVGPIAGAEQVAGKIASKWPEVEQRLAMVQGADAQERLREQWALIERVWFVWEKQPWIKSIRLNWDSSLEVFLADLSGGETKVDIERLRKQLLNDEERAVMSRDNPRFLVEFDWMSETYDESEQDFAVHYFADAVAGFPDASFEKLWAIFRAREGNRATSLLLDFSSREALAQSILSPESCAIWDAAGLRGALREQEKEIKIPSAAIDGGQKSKAGSLRL